MNVKRFVASAAVATALLGSATPALASAGTKVPDADKAVARAASEMCAPITDDVTWEACVTGAIVRISGKSAGNDYRNEPDGVYLTAPLHTIKASKGKANKADRLAMVDTNGGCAYILEGKRKHVNRWLNCQTGMFTMIRGRAITDADVKVVKEGKTLRLVLKHRSHKISGVSAR